MKKTISLTRDEWLNVYHKFADESEDVREFLVDYFKEMYGAKPSSVKIIGKLNDAIVAWICDACGDLLDCIVCVWCDVGINDDLDITLETYVWDKDRRMSVTVA